MRPQADIVELLEFQSPTGQSGGSTLKLLPSATCYLPGFNPLRGNPVDLPIALAGEYEVLVVVSIPYGAIRWIYREVLRVGRI